MSRRHLSTILRHAEALAADRPTVSDAELLAAFLSGSDDRAFAALVRRHGPMVWGVCRNLLPEDADAEDAFQATFLALVRGCRRIRSGDRLAAWLHGVAVRVAMKVRRSAARRRRHETTAAPAEAVAPVSEAAWGDLLAAVHEAVGALPESLRAAFVLCGLEGVRQADAAVRLGLKPNTLTARLVRARQRVLETLARRGIAPAAAAAALGLSSAGCLAVPIALADRAAAFTTSFATISPTVLTLSQGAFEMTTRTKWLAAALLVAGAMTTTVSSVFFADATGQQPQGGGRGAQARGGGGDDGGGRMGSGMGGGRTQGVAGPIATRWEYKVTRAALNVPAGEEELNRFGDDGWELVTVSGERPTERLVFKRPKRGIRADAVRGPIPDPPPFDPVAAPPVDPAGPGSPARRADVAPPPAAKEPRATKAQVISLKHAAAADFATTVQALFREPGQRGGFTTMLGSGGGDSGQRVSIAVDVRTNSLIVIADDTSLKTIEELVKKLDVPEPEVKPTQVSRPKTK